MATPVDGLGMALEVRRAGTIAAAALLPALVVVFWDQLEGMSGAVGSYDGGPAALLVVVIVWLAAWILSSAILWRWSRHAQTDGLLVGLLVAATVLVRALPLVREFGPFVMVAVLLFASLGMGLAAASGAVAAVAQGRQPYRALGGLVIAMAAVLFLAVLPFLRPAPMLALVVVMVPLGLAALGAWIYRRGVPWQPS